MSQAIVKAEQFDREQLALIQATVAKGTTTEEFRLFIEVCKHTRLNPFARQIYAIVRDGKSGRQLSIQTSIDGYRLLAQRSGEYAGQDGPYWYDEEKGEWVDVWIKEKPPAAAKVGVLRKGFQKYLYAVARFESYAVRGYNAQTHKMDGALTNLWAKMPELMIAKVAEALALRRAFPAELSGIYTDEEMQQADVPLPTMTVDAEIASVVPQNGHSVEQASSQVPAQKVVKIEAERESGASQDGHATEQQRAAIASMAKSLSIVVELASDATFEEARAKIVELQQQIRQRRTAVASK